MNSNSSYKVVRTSDDLLEYDLNRYAAGGWKLFRLKKTGEIKYPTITVALYIAIFHHE